jgi:hypothetical protein
MQQRSDLRRAADRLSTTAQDTSPVAALLLDLLVIFARDASPWRDWTGGKTDSCPPQLRVSVLCVKTQPFQEKIVNNMPLRFSLPRAKKEVAKH